MARSAGVGHAWRSGGRAFLALLADSADKARADEVSPAPRWSARGPISSAWTDAEVEAALGSAAWRE
eukprot:11458321-Alexandrium_andersonii.AAC.1